MTEAEHLRRVGAPLVAEEVEVLGFGHRLGPGVTVSSVAPATRPISGHNRLTGEFVALIPSSSEPGKFHVTTAIACECKGWK